MLVRVLPCSSSIFFAGDAIVSPFVVWMHVITSLIQRQSFLYRGFYYRNVINVIRT